MRSSDGTTATWRSHAHQACTLLFQLVKVCSALLKKLHFTKLWSAHATNKQTIAASIYISDCKACNLDPQVAALIVDSPTGDVLYIPQLVLGVGVG